MSNPTSWRRVWDDKAKAEVPDFELDRGISPRDREIESLSEQELINFIDPRSSERLLDAGCGTGVNILRLHSKVKSIIGIDYTQGSLDRCHKRIQDHQIKNAQVFQASVTSIPLPDCSVDKVLCLSVLQYLDHEEFRQALKEFVRVLTPEGVLILHVKNLSSLYWSTLWAAKKCMSVFGMRPQIEHFRSFQWYVDELASQKLHVLDYNSFNLLTLDRMPKGILSFLQRIELKNHTGSILRIPFVRRRGAELKIKAKVLASGANR